MDLEPGGAIIIQGITENGGRFRPSDWAERIAGNYAHLGSDRRVTYSEQVLPATRDGIICLVVRKALEQSNPSAYAEVLHFAQMNRLVCKVAASSS